MFDTPDPYLLNNQVKAYCSWKPDPYSVFVDAFTVDW
jgi:hypothetical protein